MLLIILGEVKLDDNDIFKKDNNNLCCFEEKFSLGKLPKKVISGECEIKEVIEDFFHQNNNWNSIGLSAIDYLKFLLKDCNYCNNDEIKNTLNVLNGIIQQNKKSSLNFLKN